MHHIVYKSIYACILCATLILLSGCIYKYVDVPVWVCPKPDMPIKQSLVTDTLDSNVPNTILKAMVTDLTYLKGYSSQLEILLKVYDQPVLDLYKLLPPK